MGLDFHTHDGIDSPRIPGVNLLGFPIFNSAPTHPSEEGTFALTHYGLWAMLNREWHQLGGNILTNTASLNFGAIGPSSSADLTLPLVGAVVGDIVSLGVTDAVISTGTNCTNITFFAWVSATGVVTVRCTNNDAILTANPAAGNFKVTTIQ